jgi:hypothetical protein
MANKKEQIERKNFLQKAMETSDEISLARKTDLQKARRESRSSSN